VLTRQLPGWQPVTPEGFQHEPAVWHAVGLLADGALHRRFPTLVILTRPQLLRLGIANNGPIFRGRNVRYAPGGRRYCPDGRAGCFYGLPRFRCSTADRSELPRGSSARERHPRQFLWPDQRPYHPGCKSYSSPFGSQVSLFRPVNNTSGGWRPGRGLQLVPCHTICLLPG
jgi:hypothetical protein